MKQSYFFISFAMNVVLFLALVSLALALWSAPPPAAATRQPSSMLSSGNVISAFQEQAENLDKQQDHARKTSEMLMMSCMKRIMEVVTVKLLFRLRRVIMLLRREQLFLAV